MDDSDSSLLDRLETSLPKALYRFRSFDDITLATLKQNQFWFSSADRFNDPNEFAFVASIDTFSSVDDFTRSPRGRSVTKTAFGLLASESELDATIDKGAADLRALLSSRFRQFVIETAHRTVGICCFFAAPTAKHPVDYPIRRMLFWSHYANCHRGFAIRIRPNNLGTPNVIKVDYSHVPPTANLVSGDKAMDAELLRLTTTKSTDWKDENEWRIILPKPNQRIDIGNDVVDAIYFGTRMRLSQKQALRDATHGELEYYDMILNPASYELDCGKCEF